MKLNKLKFLFSWLGPYPYNPWIIFAFFSMMYFSRFVPGISNQPAGTARWVAGAVILLAAAIRSGFFAVFAVLCKKYRFWEVNRITYIIEIALGQALLLIVFPVIAAFLERFLDLKYTAPVTLTPYLFLGSLVLVLAIFAAMHHGERAVLLKLKVADNLVSKLVVDREILLKSDEELRRQTATFLHDRVQSDLMVAAIKLKNTSAHVSYEVNEVIQRVVSILENTRAIDLKNLTQVLAPNFEATGLELALNKLVGQFQSSMTICIAVVDHSENLDPRIQLGIFRITEQALLNSLVHGPAKTANVSLVTNSVGTSVLTISDNGPGASSDSNKPGVGTAVIDSWVSTLNARKFIDTVPGHGYQLRVEIPKTSAA